MSDFWGISSDPISDIIRWSHRIKELERQEQAHRSLQLQIAVGMISESWYVPRGEVMRIAGYGLVAHPATAMVLNNNGVMPLWTRHDRGVIELERDRRRRRSYPDRIEP